MVRVRFETIAITADIKQCAFQILVYKKIKTSFDFFLVRWCFQWWSWYYCLWIYKIYFPFNFKSIFTKRNIIVRFYQITFQRSIWQLFYWQIIASFIRPWFNVTFQQGRRSEQGACNILMKGGFNRRNRITNFKKLTKTYEWKV